jgi:hypothetical protein
MFDLPVAGRRRRLPSCRPISNAIFPNRTESRLGWRLTRDAIAGMHAVSRSFGAEFAVMLCRSGAGYLPLLEHLSRRTLRASFSFI